MIGGPGSVRRLLLQVVLLAVLLLGLFRMAGRAGKPTAGGGDPAHASGVPPSEDEMSSGPPDLTFYRTLGTQGPAPAGGGLAVGGINKEAPTRSPASVGNGGYIVQALATRDGMAARRLRDRLAGRGFPATVTEDRSGGQSVYRVRVGRYRTRGEAEAAVRVLRQKQHLSPWVLQEGD